MSDFNADRVTDAIAVGLLEPAVAAVLALPVVLLARWLGAGDGALLPLEALTAGVILVGSRVARAREARGA